MSRLQQKRREAIFFLTPKSCFSFSIALSCNISNSFLHGVQSQDQIHLGLPSFSSSFKKWSELQWNAAIYSTTVLHNVI